MSSHKSSEKKIGGIVILLILSAFILIYFYINSEAAKSVVGSITAAVPSTVSSLSKEGAVVALAG